MKSKVQSRKVHQVDLCQDFKDFKDLTDYVSMDQFIVPQFIDVEDKILGPITVRQFVMMIAGGLFLVVAFKLFDISLFIFVTLLTIGAVGLFGFVKVNGRPFHFFLIAVFQVSVKPRLRVWNNADVLDFDHKDDTMVSARRVIKAKRLSRSRLTEIALQVDTGGVFMPDEEDSINPQFLQKPERDLHENTLHLS